VIADKPCLRHVPFCPAAAPQTVWPGTGMMHPYTLFRRDAPASRGGGPFRPQCPPEKVLRRIPFFFLERCDTLQLIVARKRT
jgi:hypothetical protein